jgi:hypothetical protein
METARQIPRSAPVPQLREAIRERTPNPVRFGLFLVLRQYVVAGHLG